MNDAPVRFSTCDLCDSYADELQIVTPLFRHFGGLDRFTGVAVTLRCPEDNSLVRVAVAEPGEGKVLVVDGGASLRRALVGDQLAGKALANGWAGIIVNGAIRDVDALRALPIGVMALASIPIRGEKLGAGERNVIAAFGGVTISPDARIYADANGIVVASRDLLAA